jgi:toxin FitB
VSYLWDTCVLSELGKPNRDPDVASFLAGIPTGETWISAITVGEIEFGIARLPIGKRRAELEAVMNTMLSELSSRVLPRHRRCGTGLGRHHGTGPEPWLHH